MEDGGVGGAARQEICRGSVLQRLEQRMEYVELPLVRRRIEVVDALQVTRWAGARDQAREQLDIVRVEDAPQGHGERVLDEAIGEDHSGCRVLAARAGGRALATPAPHPRERP